MASPCSSVGSSSGDGSSTLDTEPLVRDPQAPSQDGSREGGHGALGARGWCARRRFGQLLVASVALVGLAITTLCGLPGGAARVRHPLQLIGLYGDAPVPSPYPADETSASTSDKAAAVELLPWRTAILKAKSVEARLTGKERYGLLHGIGFLTVGHWVGATKGIPRLGIPALKLQDSSNGFRPTAPGEMGTTTSWPSSLALASAWDESVVSATARAIAIEFKGKGANVLLGPGVNVHRTAYGGRNFEYLSGEDPYLGGRLAAAYVKAVQSEGVMAVVKHFAFNEQETNRNWGNVVVSERAAWELYYPPFEAAINAGAAAIMCAYNQVNGEFACGNSNLLLRDLKEKMGFKGFVMSDWEAAHGINDLSSGLDMEQPSGKHFDEEVLGNMSQVPIREAARRVLASIYHLRLDQFPGCALPCSGARSSNVRTRAHLKLAREAATAGVVLLKNDGVLPLSRDHVRTLAVLGTAASAQDTLNTWGPGSAYSGGGSGHVPAPHVVTPLQGIKERAHAAGITVLDDSTHVEEEREEDDGDGAQSSGAMAELDMGGPEDSDAPREETPREEKPRRRRSKPLDGLARAKKIAEKADVVIVVGSATTTESKDRQSLSLDAGADDLVHRIAGFRPTVVLMEVPGAVLTPWRVKASAIACLFMGGEETGRAWASVIFGDVSPTGKLAVTLPVSEHDTIRPGNPDAYYTEELMTSYRSLKMKAAYPFGHGLTFTQFELGVPATVTDNCTGAACIQVTVTNVGERAGSEVVQAYLVFDPHVKEPNQSLRGFQRTRLLEPGEREVLRFQFTVRDVSTYTEGHGWRQQEWAVVRLGTSSQDIRHLMPLRTSMPIRMLK